MRWRRTGYVAGAVLLAGVIVFAAIAWQPAIPPVKSPDIAITPELVSKGRTVVALGDCAVCHSPEGHPAFSGGLGLRTPFGVIYTTNITPDVETGIGAWSLDAFMRAMRHGVSRDGHLLYPAFPYIHYTKVTDDDLRAAYAYLMTQPAVHAPAPRNDLPLPLRFRPALAVWNLLYLRPGAAPALDASPRERGRYLVEGLGHCSSCHTALGIIGGESGRYLGGGDVDGWHAPALDVLAHAPRPWTVEQLSAYLTTGLASEHGASAGPMRPVTDNLGDVPPEDVHAIATYLMTIQTSQPPTAPKAGAVADASQLARGHALFDGVCATCHGDGGPMETQLGRPPLAASSALQGPTPRNAIMMVLQGIPWPSHPKPTAYMPAFADNLTDDQIADLVVYLRSTTSQPPWPDVRDEVRRARKDLSHD
ncbi:Cytochrome c, mono-and diheme variants [Luteibacter sp. UNC138MFCol5.1]|uniref:c-type cytochrome n=1 Tax=Luteibacter sp. UNC138MFCol5.1 TaxID=1502774 RepID=UPI0008B9CE88|nr:c-type cytochrome [Luteibacter sp. UNC138MFCol5.1]SEO89873.1 Cytochrome c, mono-and diheme variants [Luteibacter sp. UNC138MFCol5.1]